MRALMATAKLAVVSMVLLCTPAQAAIVPIAPGGAFVLTAGDTYQAGQIKAGGSGAFTDTYTFAVDVPPPLGASLSDTNLILGNVVGINGFGFEWELLGTGILNSAVGVVTDQVLTVLNADGVYELRLFGTSVQPGFGFYTASLTASAAAVPLPGAALLFLTGLLGLGGLSLRRRHKARAA